MKDHAHADIIEFISADYQRAMATENDNVDDGSRLTKNDKTAPDYKDPVYKDTISPLASMGAMGTTESMQGNTLLQNKSLKCITQIWNRETKRLQN